MNDCHRTLSRYGCGCVLSMIAATFVACADTSVSDDPALAHAQGTSGSQQDLWQQRAGNPDLARLQAGTGEVTIARALQVEANPTAGGEQKTSPQVATQVLVERVPDSALGDKPLTTRGRVLGVQAEMLTIQAPEGTVRLQTRVGGRTLALGEGEEVDVEIQSGTPFRRSDYVQVRGEKDALGYALVGGDAPVTIELSFFDLTARQDGPRAGDNTMGVTVQVGNESQRVDKLGETLRFEAAGLLVQVLASVAADEEAAALLPESHRLEIVVWPVQN